VATDFSNARSTIFIRLAVGLIFLTQGILKYIDPHMGVVRFTRIGFPLPAFTSHFDGAFEIGCGLLVLLGFLTSLACVPSLFVIPTDRAPAREAEESTRSDLLGTAEQTESLRVDSSTALAGARLVGMTKVICGSEVMEQPQNV